MTHRKILVVENDSSTRKLLEVLLRRHGHETTSVEAGAQAIELLERSAFDVVIVDLMMPEVSGHDVIAYVAERSPQTPVIVCTAAGPKITDALQSSVVKAVIRKPFDILQLTAAVEAHALSPSAAREPAVTVLIVDDDERARYVMRTMVAPAETVEAEDAEAALRAVQAQRPDVILLDLALPGMPGEEFLRRLKDDEETRDLPIVIVTSRKLPPTERTALERADGYIYKGDLTREMLRTVLQVIVKTPSQ